MAPDLRVIVTGPSGVRRFAGQQKHWLYLGRDIAKRKQVTRLLGEAYEEDPQERFQKITAGLRQPFLDFVGGIGNLQTDPMAWWSTRFSWKMWTNSDLFLLICTLHLAEEIIRDRRDENRVVVVEDRWLLRQLLENHAPPADTHVLILQQPSLLWERVIAFLVGILRRGKWLFSTIRNGWAQRRVWPPQGTVIPQRPAAALFSYPTQEALPPGEEWEDPHLRQTASALLSNDLEVFRFTPPDAGGFEKELARRSSYVRPLILEMNASLLWKALTVSWKPVWPASIVVAGLSVEWLAQREAWQEMGRASVCSSRLFYECLRKMLKKGTWRCLVTFYENQPWEKMAALASREAGVPLVGIQTAILSPYYLPYFLGKTESTDTPHPDLICASGPYAQRLLLEGGNPKQGLRMCGSIRYHRTAQRAAGAAKQLPPAPRTKILVALPIYRPLVEELLAALAAAFPEGGAAEGLRFYVRPHPLCPVDSKGILFPAERISSDFFSLEESLRDCGSVLFVGSTVGFEAAAAGRAVLRYRPRLFPDVDVVYDPWVPVCEEKNVREAMLRLVHEKEDPDRKIQAQHAVLELFAPLDTVSFQEVFRDFFHDKISGFCFSTRTSKCAP